MSSVLQMQQVSKQFGQKQVLKSIDLSLEPGHIVGLVGENGAGKSTLMKTILGLLPVNHGTVTVFDQQITLSRHASLDRVGALIEYPSIYPFLSGRKHLHLFAADNTDQDQVNAVIDALDMGSYIDQQAKNYSLGMKQKLGIALAVLNQPDLVILDEPMNGLDPKATRQVRDLIFSMKQNGTTILISSHILSELEKVIDDIIILDQGHIVRNEPMQSLSDESVDYLVLKTSDDATAKQLLAANQFVVPAELADDARVIFAKTSNDTLAQAITQLTAANIAIYDVVHEHNDLEATLLNVLTADQTEVAHD
ncbi:ABC transporter ATP-binding protein [Lacticaseibacillus brantae]|nr:ATP-binding cassette domain-containing protein [Lacticaseibacillus brantae]